MQLFSEIYGAYFRTVERILGQADISESEIRKLIEQEAFRDSLLFLPQKFRPESEENWGFLKRKPDGTLRRVTRQAPPGFVTLLQKRWLRAKLSDPRMRLFLTEESLHALEDALSDVKPLYPVGVFRYFDVFSDGDPYDSPHYQDAFRTVLAAIHEKEVLWIRFVSGRGQVNEGCFLPLKLEYSQKNDKFRLFCYRVSKNNITGNGTINLGRIAKVKRMGQKMETSGLLEDWCRSRRCKEPVQVKVHEERNGIERFLMEFASFEKRTERDEPDASCTVWLWYDIQDETELLIQLLSFGPVVEIIGPPGFRAQAAKRVAMQYALLQESEGHEIN